MFVTEERRAWMRLRTHTVVFDREPDFARYAADRSGSVVTILRVWVAEASNPTVTTLGDCFARRPSLRGSWEKRSRCFAAG